MGKIKWKTYIGKINYWQAAVSCKQTGKRKTGKAQGAGGIKSETESSCLLKQGKQRKENVQGVRSKRENCLEKQLLFKQATPAWDKEYAEIWQSL